MSSSNIYKVMKAIAEGYYVEGTNDRFVVVDNPEYKNPWDDPFIVVDIGLDFGDYEALTAENAALRLRIDDWREEVKSARSMRELYGRKNVELIAGRDALRDALEYYAPRVVDGIVFDGNDDKGRRAAAALRDLKGWG